jgi:hypothetical protein
MTEAKPSKPTFAEKRIEFLRGYLATLEALEDRDMVDPQGLGEQSQAFAERLAVDRPELVRIAAEVGYRITTADRHAEIRKAVKVVIREWERAGDVTRERVPTLKAYLEEIRRLEQLEIPFQRAQQRASVGMALSDGRRILAEHGPQITELKDILCEEQPSIERMLNEVGCSFGTQSLALGAHGSVDFFAGQIGKAVGLYREWPTTRLTPWERRELSKEESAPPPAGPTFNINANASSHVQVTVSQMIDDVSAAIEGSAAPPEKKKVWLETLKDIGGHLVGAGAKALADKLLGPGPH